jgi:hypothetical protein
VGNIESGWIRIIRRDEGKNYGMDAFLVSIIGFLPKFLMYFFVIFYSILMLFNYIFVQNIFRF